MPNGGVPLHMVLYPHDGECVFYCRASELRVVSKDEWNRDRARATPVCVLTEAESAALASHLRHWLGEARLKPGYSMRDEVDAQYDF